jgi:UDP-N-acetylglucosamine acyltransferase
MSDISKLAVIHADAKIGADVRIAPFCVIGPDVSIGDRCELMNNVTIDGCTVIGSHNIFYQNAVIGVASQDLKYKGQKTKTIIGNKNVFRENCTVHRGTELGGGKTVIGNHNLLMIACHIAHDCTLENKIILSNLTQLAGHVKIEEGAVVLAMIGIHHFVTVGRYSYIGAMTPVHRDVPPFMKFSGEPNEVRGVNEEGLKRNNFSADDIDELKKAYRKLFREGRSISEQIDKLQTQGEMNGHVRYLCQFIRNSCSGRFGRHQENARQDNPDDRLNRIPVEIRKK